MHRRNKRTRSGRSRSRRSFKKRRSASRASGRSAAGAFYSTRPSNLGRRLVSRQMWEDGPITKIIKKFPIVGDIVEVIDTIDDAVNPPKKPPKAPKPPKFTGLSSEIYPETPKRKFIPIEPSISPPSKKGRIGTHYLFCF